jgi:acyl-coenzyme A thioesterase PaaI-like protein
MPEDHAVLSVEFKQNLLAPAKGERFRATARVVKAGRTLTVCTADVVAVTGAEETLVAVLQGTMISLPNRQGREA